MSTFSLSSDEQDQSTVFVGRLDYFTSDQNQSFLYLYDLKTGISKKIDLPENLQNRTLLEIFPVKRVEQQTSSKIYVLSQIHKAGADKPRIDLYDLKSKKWTSVKEDIDCVNFSNLSFEKESLSMNCDEDYINPPKSPKISIKLPGALPAISKNSNYNLKFSADRNDVTVQVRGTNQSFNLLKKLM